MIKPKKYDWKDSNLALFGSDVEKGVKRDAANLEPAWKGSGRAKTCHAFIVTRFLSRVFRHAVLIARFSSRTFVIMRLLSQYHACRAARNSLSGLIRSGVIIVVKTYVFTNLNPFR